MSKKTISNIVPEPAPIPENEALRQFELEQYDVLDTLPERQFDDLVSLAATICQTPMASLTLIDNKRQWFKSAIGMGSTETPRDVAFCAHAIMDSEMLVVTDATQDQRFESNPFVSGEPNIRFYAGAPLINVNGYALGTLCVIDTKPRKITSKQKAGLEALGRIATDLLEQRRDRQELLLLISERDKAEDALEQFEQTVEIEHSRSAQTLTTESMRPGYPNPMLIAATVASSALIGYLVGEGKRGES